MSSQKQSNTPVYTENLERINHKSQKIDKPNSRTNLWKRTIREKQNQEETAIEKNKVKLTSKLMQNINEHQSTETSCSANITKQKK